jgi:hypothetical protein
MHTFPYTFPRGDCEVLVCARRFVVYACALAAAMGGAETMRHFGMWVREGAEMWGWHRAAENERHAVCRSWVRMG